MKTTPERFVALHAIASSMVALPADTSMMRECLPGLLADIAELQRENERLREACQQVAALTERAGKAEAERDAIAAVVGEWQAYAKNWYGTKPIPSGGKSLTNLTARIRRETLEEAAAHFEKWGGIGDALGHTIGMEIRRMAKPDRSACLDDLLGKEGGQ
jgi:regulator of replication initiation timing